MRIYNSPQSYTTLAKCTKMTEEEHKIHGMNGVADSGTAPIKEESSHSSDAYSLGGRLRFFKNGRFILELARAREGEKTAWVPVPKKTYWPPQGSASSISTYRQESSTSLSVSDDNSSVQSSPWQRDHTWKQTTPQRNLSNHLSFYFSTSKRHRRLSHLCWRTRLPRAPYTIEQRTQKCNKCNNKSAMRATLAQVVQLLWNKSLQSVASPRKRILREMERVSIDDLSYKRCKGKKVANGGDSVKNCSYSITALLAGKPEVKMEKTESSQNQNTNPSRASVVEDFTSNAVDALRTADILPSVRPPVGGRNPASPSSDHYQQPPQPPPPPPSHYPYVAPYPVYPVLGSTYVPPYCYSASPYYSGFMPPITHSWTTYQPSIHSDDSDVPLNLSKHAD